MWKKVVGRIVSVILVISVSLNMGSMEIQAATFQDITASSVFLKQKTKETCTLCSAAMMLRRAAILRGDSHWKNITENSVRAKAWADGLSWNFTYSNFRVEHGNLSGSATSKKSRLIQLLNNHPEGIVLYYRGSTKQHAVLLTDYTNGVFYCSDPYWGKPDGRIPLSQSLYVTAENAQYYWAITSPDLQLEEETPVEEEKTGGSIIPEDIMNSVGGKLLANENALSPYNYVDNLKTKTVKKLSLKAAKKAISVKWEKVEGVSGYKITYATNADFKKAKSVTVGKVKNNVVLKNLKAKKNYYIKIRTFCKETNGKTKGKVFYAYSKVRKIKTK